MKLSTIILLWTLNFISTKYDRLKTIKKSQAKFYVDQQSEMDFLHTESSVGQQHGIHRRPAYLSGASAQGASRSHAMDVYRHSSQNHLSAEYKSTVRCKKPLIAPPYYDGTTSLSQFRQSFNDSAIMNNWETEMEKALWLRNSLKAQARGIIYDNCYDVNELWSRLESRFGDELKLRQYERLLATRVRKHDESLTDLADDIRKMSLIVYRGINYYAQERLMISHFTRALSDVDMEYDISQQQPATLEQALLIAQNREIYFQPESNQSALIHISSSTLSPTDLYDDYVHSNYRSNKLCEDQTQTDNYHIYNLSVDDTASYSSYNCNENYCDGSNYNELNENCAILQTTASFDSDMGNAIPIPR